ncbi:VWA domain-containing protein [Aquimarina sp. AU58]|uniref:VWA domain-containing protein n=1 Tax=Aquimarina sp. AU58 TaxID=1874112 RepID=UPI000D6E9554|nr:VWA domain-containing protein [Aquimarina sp. AU58]
MIRFKKQPSIKRGIFCIKRNGIHSENFLQFGAIILVLFISLTSQAQWIQQGPGPSKNGQVENITDRHVVGAVNCVTPHPSNADVLYIGGTNGGVWKTENALSSPPNWTLISGTLPSQSIGALEFDPTDASNQTLVMGNGRTSSFLSAGGGTRGVYRTTTGNAPWTNIDTGGLFSTRDITGIAARGATIIVASDSGGIWRTTNTGGNWIQISGGVGTGLPSGNSFDLVSDPNDTTILYTNAGTNGIYISNDTGATWTKISNATVDTSLAGAGNLELAIGNNNNLYVAIVTLGRLSALYRSGDAGVSWDSALDIPTTIETGNIHGIHVGGQGNTHLSLIADPSNDDVVYIGGDRQPWANEPVVTPFLGFPNSLGANDYSGRLFRVDASQPSGSQFTSITHVGTASNSAPHADSRDMDFDANGDLIEGDDGGVYKQTAPINATGDWFSLNGNINISEIHSVDWDANSNIIISGLQDNGVPEQEFPTNSTWNTIVRGDGGDVAIDDVSSTTTSTRYASSQNLGNFRSRVYSTGNVFQSQVFPGLINTATGLAITNFGFVNPIKVNNQDGRILIATNGALFESSDGGATVTSISTFTVNGIFTNDSGEDAIAYGANDNADIIYAGSGSNVQIRTAAAPAAFTNSTAYTGGSVQGVTLDPDDSQSAYVIDSNSVFETDDTGSSWTDITGNLLLLNPGSTFRSIAYIPNSGDDILAVGTDIGVFIAPGPNFSTWAPLGTNLPPVPVYDLEYDTADDILLAGTLGRGAWTFNFSERDPVDVALVLDISGSMLSNACSTCDPKLDVLKESVEIFMQLWKGLAVEDDRIGTIYFRTNVDNFSSGGDVLLPVIDNTDAMITNVNSQTTSATQLTAMGGGLQVAINELTDTSRPRNIILFTDGMQNVDPGVSFPGLDIQNGEFGTNSNVNPTTPATTLDNALGIKVNTIGVGATSSFESQLADISSATNGVTKITTAPDEDLRQFFVEELVDALRSFSPQLVAYRKGILNDLKTESFSINSPSKQVVFKVSYALGDEISVSIRKGKVDVTQFARVINGGFYKIYSFPFEVLSLMQGPRFEGDWSVVLRNGARQASYEIAAITDESSLKYNLSAGNLFNLVGQPIAINAEVLVNDELVDENITVTAKVLRPKQGLGTLLSTTNAPAPTTFEPGLPIGAQKLSVLVQDPSFVNKITPIEQPITLSSGSDKVFRENFTNTNIPGTYTIIYTIKGNHPFLGNFERTEQRSVVVRFANFSFDDSDVFISKSGPGADGNYTWIWEFEPKDKFGNYLGPDYGHVFDIHVTNGVLKEIKDMGNGTYQIEMSTTTDRKPDIKIQLYDEVWHDGTLPDTNTKQWFLSFHAGTTLPRGNLNTFFDSGIYGKLDVEWKIKKQYSLQFLAGFEHFKPDLNILSGVLQLKGYLPIRRNLNIYGELGPGVHGVLNDKSYLSANAGIGLDFELSSKSRLSIGANYTKLFDHPSDFYWFGMGIGYHFRIK